MRRGRALVVLGAAARWTRRARLERGLGFFVDSADRVFAHAQKPPLTANVDGVQFRGYLRHRSFLEYLATGMTKESYYRSLILNAVEAETTFVDAGAHIGLYTVLACQKAHRVVAFEPDPYNVAALRINVERRGCGNVEIHAQALADRAGRARFHAFRSTFSGSLVAREVEAYRECETELVSLDDVLAEDVANLVVKLDVEGAEPLVLAGMRETIRRARKLTLFVEVNPQALEAGGSSARRLVTNLLGMGMECAFVDEERRTLVSLIEDRPLGKGNLRCQRASSA